MVGYFPKVLDKGPFTNDVATLNNQRKLKKLTKADEEGPRVIRKVDEWLKIQRYEGTHPKKTLVGLTRLTWTLLGQIMMVVTQILLTLMEINWILKLIVFGSGLYTNDIVNLKHQGAFQKLMIGWHKHQGVSETPKNADVICEQPLICRCVLTPQRDLELALS